MTTTEESKVKYLKNEIAAFEGRLSTVKTEVDAFRKQKESLAVSIDAIKSAHNLDVERRTAETRQASALVDKAREKLESDKKEFEAILTQFKKDKAAVEREKQEALDLRTEAKRTFDRVGAFIVTVRNEAQKL